MKFIQAGNQFFALSKFSYYEFKAKHKLAIRLLVEVADHEDYMVALDDWDFDYIKSGIAEGKSDLSKLTSKEEKMEHLEKLAENLTSRFSRFLRDEDKNLFVVEQEMKEHLLKISKFNFV